MLHGLCSRIVVLYQQNVEPAGAISNTVLCEIVRGQLNQFGALTRIDGLNRTPVRFRLPAFYFDEYEHSPIIGD
jgi:hypothetical protein